MNSLQGFKALVLSQLLVGALGTAVLTVGWDSQLGASFGIGAGLMLLNVVLLGWGWWRILEKKSIAWTVVIIVIKYAVLLSTIVFLSRTDWFHAMPAGLGIFSFILAALAAAVWSENLSGINKEG